MTTTILIQLIVSGLLLGGIYSLVSVGLTMIFGLGLILTLFNLKCHSPQNLDMLRFGWVFALLVVLAQATWELLTGERLPSVMTERREGYLTAATACQSIPVYLVQCSVNRGAWFALGGESQRLLQIALALRTAHSEVTAAANRQPC